MAEDSFCSPYNLVLTTEWMMLVPRSAGEVEDVASVNGFGFIGYLLAETAGAQQAIRDSGPLDVLRKVTVPAR
jgi:ATP adenylyltransferase